MKIVCEEIFGDKKCLCMMEKKGGDHLHVQGETHLDDKVLDAYLKQVANLHYRRKQDPSSRPIKRRKTVADDKGFQYMSKELPNSVVIYKQGFTDEDLQELYDKSNELREELQSKLGEYLVSTFVSGSSDTPRDMHKRLCSAALKYYMDQDKMCPPNIKLLVRHFFLKYWGSDPRVVEYLSELIM